jgi:hypothetical protein
MPMHSSNSSSEVVADQIDMDSKRNEAIRYLEKMILKIEVIREEIFDKFSRDREFSESDKKELKD